MTKDSRDPDGTPMPLEGVVVVDLSRHLPGPLVARLLSDLGARVVKVEEPRSGDPVREAPPFTEEGSALAGILLAGVESVALNLKEPEAREVLHGLLEEADVLLESFRPGTLARFDLAPDTLRERHPELVIASVSGWGQDGPHASRAGHDLTYEAIGGLLGTTGEMPPAPIADIVGAWSGVSSILAALLARRRTGRGSWIDVSLLDAAIHSNLTGWASTAGGSSGTRTVGLTGSLPCYRLYETADGRQLAVACLEPHFWKRFCEASGHPELEKLHLDTSRRAHRDVEAVIRARTRLEWEAFLEAEDLPVEPVLDAEESRRHPQVVARRVLSEVEGASPRLRFPTRFDGERAAPGGEIPELGEDTGRLLEEIGSSLAERSRRQRRRRGVGRRWSFVSWLRRKWLEWRW